MLYVIFDVRLWCVCGMRRCALKNISYKYSWKCLHKQTNAFSKPWKKILSYSFVYTGNVQYTRKSINLNTFSSIIDLPILHKPPAVEMHVFSGSSNEIKKYFDSLIKTQLAAMLNAEKSTAMWSPCDERVRISKY